MMMHSKREQAARNSEEDNPLNNTFQLECSILILKKKSQGTKFLTYKKRGHSINSGLSFPRDFGCG